MRADEWGKLLADRRPRRFAPKSIRHAARGEEAVDRIRRTAMDAGLIDFLRGAREDAAPLLVIVNDTHRPTDTRLAIEALCRAADDIDPRMPFRMLVSTGSHRFENDDEMRAHEERILAARAARFVDRAWHDALDNSSMAPLNNGAHLHRWLVEAKFALAIGSMEPHYFAGATGAFKTFSVGCMRFEDITSNHRGALKANATGLRLDGNPVYDGLAEIVSELKTDRRLFAINEILAGGGLVDCYCGDPIETQRAALPILRDTFGATVDKPFDIIVSIVKPPLNRDLYQADKGIKNIEAAIRDGGVILLEADCDHGIGIDRFHALLKRAPRHIDALALIEREGYTLGDHKAARLRALTDSRGVHIGLLSRGVSRQDAEIAGMTMHASRPNAVDWALRLTSGDPAIAIVDDAGNFTLGPYYGARASRPHA